MALSVGIVGLPGSGKTTLFNALTGAGASEYGKEHVGMAAIADRRLDEVAEVIGSAKKTPAAIRVVDVPGRRDPRRPRRLLGQRRPRSRPRDAEARAPGRRPRPRRAPPRAGPQGSEVRRPRQESGGRARRGAPRPRRVGRLAGRRGRAPPRARAADDEAADPDRQRPRGARREARARAGRAPGGGGGRVPPRQAVRARRCRRKARRRARSRHVHHRRRHRDARLDAPPRPDRARRGRDDPFGYFARLHPRRGDSLGRSRPSGLACEGGGRGSAAARGQVLCSLGRRRP
jgi:energy-coupling factor transporter ATP-binding protein EcfA2